MDARRWLAAVGPVVLRLASAASAHAMPRRSISGCRSRDGPRARALSVLFGQRCTPGSASPAGAWPAVARPSPSACTWPNSLSTPPGPLCSSPFERSGLPCWSSCCWTAWWPPRFSGSVTRTQAPPPFSCPTSPGAASPLLSVTLAPTQVLLAEARRAGDRPRRRRARRRRAHQRRAYPRPDARSGRRPSDGGATALLTPSQRRMVGPPTHCARPVHGVFCRCMVLRCARSEAVDRGCSRAWCTASALNPRVRGSSLWRRTRPDQDFNGPGLSL